MQKKKNETTELKSYINPKRICQVIPSLYFFLLFLVSLANNIVKINCGTPESYKKWSENSKNKIYITTLTN
jgi:hypothetical protein